MANSSNSAKPDGGGIRGMSELLILNEIMHRIEYKQNLDTTPLPCKYFDMIGGTSTGGSVSIFMMMSVY
jgi:patatin-like phospholipase/acyl hydrolase